MRVDFNVSNSVNALYRQTFKNNNASMVMKNNLACDSVSFSAKNKKIDNENKEENKKHNHSNLTPRALFGVLLLATALDATSCYSLPPLPDVPIVIDLHSQPVPPKHPVKCNVPTPPPPRC